METYEENPWSPSDIYLLQSRVVNLQALQLTHDSLENHQERTS